MHGITPNSSQELTTARSQIPEIHPSILIHPSIPFHANMCSAVLCDNLKDAKIRGTAPSWCFSTDEDGNEWCC